MKIKKYFDVRGKSFDINYETNIDYKIELKYIIDKLKELQIKNNAIGISAPQIGKRIRLIIALDEVMINPVLVSHSEETVELYEGCLSCPNAKRKISRFSEIKVEYIDEEGNIQINSFRDLKARVIQHEIDHLEGRLIIDY